jgi:hypothetical protein
MTGLIKHLHLTAYAALTLATSTAATSAAPNCQCVTKGQRVDLGTVICLEVSPSVRYLARCERVLNNTSWKKLEEGCPSALLCIPEENSPQFTHAG